MRGFQQVKDGAMDEFKDFYPTGKNANRSVVGDYSIAIGKIWRQGKGVV
jgi:hypothetical protein